MHHLTLLMQLETLKSLLHQIECKLRNVTFWNSWDPEIFSLGTVSKRLQNYCITDHSDTLALTDIMIMFSMRPSEVKKNFLPGYKMQSNLKYYMILVHQVLSGLTRS